MNDIQDYLRGVFKYKLDSYQQTLYLKGKENKEYLDNRGMRLCDDALNIAVHAECVDGGNKFGNIHMHYGHYIICTKKKIFVVLPYLNDELMIAFPMCSSPEVSGSIESVVEKVKELRDELYKGKKVKVELVKFYPEGKMLASDGSIINEFGKYDYLVMRDAEHSEKNGDSYDESL